MPDLVNYSEGELLKVSFNVESREYNQKWYTDLRAWRIERASIEGDAPNSPVSTQSFPQPITQGTPPPQTSQQLPGDLPEDAGEDDLPF